MKPRRSGRVKPRLVPDLPLASWRKNCSGVLPILRSSPTSVTATSTTTGTTAVWAKTVQLQLT